MKADLRFDFLADKEKHTLTISREFAAKRQLVWDCHTKSELLDQWFAPKPLTTKTKHMDFREGGYWHYAMITPDGQHYWNRLDYLKIEPIDRYTARDGFCDEAGIVSPEMPRSSWEVTFDDGSDRTLVTTKVVYASPEDLQKAIDMGLKDGLASTMERLDELLQTLLEPLGQ
ncbi:MULTISPECIES: SRPBCC domain-containing protein [unclassified Bradyrhizobium]|uniref:SRPBCC family protein n=1 Tax=unclassified Bradyrhizobium TaxID=2631580 RepID=UPI00291646CE|nr:MULTISPECIES: SRPBCC domain-containing protein [unclassified Bradyrhizobium]